MKKLFELKEEEKKDLFDGNIIKIKHHDKFPGLVLVKTDKNDLCLSIWKPLLLNQNSLHHMIKLSKIIVILYQGGDFSSCYFERNELKDHKSFHKYIIRKKQGKKQSSNDRGHHASSAGAQIRRENEKNLVADVKELVDSWSNYFKESELILIDIPDIKNRKSVLNELENDKKVQNIPFSVPKANFENAKLVLEKVTKIKITNEDFEVDDMIEPLTPITDIEIKPKYFQEDLIPTPITPIDRDDFDKFFSEKVKMEMEQNIKKNEFIEEKKVHRQIEKSKTKNNFVKFFVFLFVILIGYFLIK